ncbi:hypothetical protein D3C87_1421190 [compost metagenome]
MLAAAIGIDRPVETDIGAVVAGNRRFRLLDLHFRAERLELLECLPAIVERLAAFILEASARVQAGASAAPPIDLDPEPG